MANFSTLFSFDANQSNGANASGAEPSAALTADAQGNLYGTTESGGANSTGTVYELVAGANGYTEQTLFSFAAQDPNTHTNATGADPYAGLISDAAGDLYGTTGSGGANGGGVVYELVKGPTGYTQQTLFSFAVPSNGGNATGNFPFAGLIADAQGNLYGSAQSGGANSTGTVYELVEGANGYTEQTLFSFASRDPNTSANTTGAYPLGSLLSDGQGNLYGTAEFGGANNSGAVYELAKGVNGYTEQTLFSFAANTYPTGNATGADPIAGLTADAAGNLYGTTVVGGTNDTGAVFELVKGANGYTEQTLFSFAAQAQTQGAGPNATGASPYANVIIDGAGNLYGTAVSGGANDGGTVYELVKDANGYTEQTLFSFAADGNGNMTGAEPLASLIADAQGDLYSTAIEGGTNENGTVFELAATGFVVCYVAGTSIRVFHEGCEADAVVESLAIGDLVVTASGAHRPIRWLGRRSYTGRFANRNPAVLPVCFKAGSLADGVPARDLWVSPKHAMFLDGVLVPAEHLVNGTSVIKATRVDRVDYYHVELDSHDVLLAEGAPSESFVDDEGRQIFHNAHEHAVLYPDAVRTEAIYCAPRVEDGHSLETIRRRIEARARSERSTISPAA